MSRIESFAAIILLSGMAVAHAQEPASGSTSAGVFTEEQAQKGATAYSANCAICHGSELRSTDREIPNLSDRSFQFSWIGKTIAPKSTRTLLSRGRGCQGSVGAARERGRRIPLRKPRASG